MRVWAGGRGDTNGIGGADHSLVFNLGTFSPESVGIEKSFSHCTLAILFVQQKRALQRGVGLHVQHNHFGPSDAACIAGGQVPSPLVIPESTGTLASDLL